MQTFEAELLQYTRRHWGQVLAWLVVFCAGGVGFAALFAALEEAVR